MCNYAKEFVEHFGFDKLADDMRFAKLDKPITEKFHTLEQEYLKKASHRLIIFL